MLVFKHLCLAPTNWRRRYWSLYCQPGFNEGCLQMFVIELSQCSVPNLPTVLSMNGCWIFSSCFACVYWHDHQILLLSLLIWQLILNINFQILNQPCMPEINLTPQWYILYILKDFIHKYCIASIKISIHKRYWSIVFVNACIICG